MVATKAKPPMVPVPSDQVQSVDVDAIDDNKSYYAMIQLGASKSWRKFGSGRYAALEGGGYEHRPAIHRAGPLLGSTVKGIAVAHNEWLDANRKRTNPIGTDSHATPPGVPPARREVANVFVGDLSRQFLLLSFDETTDPLDEPRTKMNQTEMLESLLSKLVPAISSAVATAVAAEMKKQK